MKVLTVVGARPQFIKASVVSLAFQTTPHIQEAILHTGQHFDRNMSDIFFDELGIPAPTWHLGIDSMGHGAMTGRQLEKIEEVLIAERPDIMLVYGDTNSTLAGALAAAKLHIPVAHVEAGIRSWNKKMPEEINRIMTDHVSTLLFPPTDDAVANLAREGLTDGVHQIGDVMLDCARHFGPRADAATDILDRLSLTDLDYRLCTLHRQENTDDPARLEAIFAALQSLAQEMPLVLPLHPRTLAVLHKYGRFDAWTKGLTIINPVGYLDITALLRGARLVLTDSGGLQKEAFFHDTPVVILRDETEWIDLLRMGWAQLGIPTSRDNILNAVCVLGAQSRDNNDAQPFGDGTAANKIAKQIAALS